MIPVGALYAKMRFTKIWLTTTLQFKHLRRVTKSYRFKFCEKEKKREKKKRKTDIRRAKSLNLKRDIKKKRKVSER